MLIFDSRNPYPGPLKTTWLLRRLYICCSECWLEMRWRALGPPRSLVSTRLVVIVMSILKERVWEGNLFIFENCPHSPASRGSARVPLTDRILPSVWLDHPTGLDNLELWHDFNCDGATCITIFSAVIAAIIWITIIKFQLTGRELLRLMCRVRGVAPQVCKNDQNVVEEEEDYISN